MWYLKLVIPFALLIAVSASDIRKPDLKRGVTDSSVLGPATLNSVSVEIFAPGYIATYCVLSGIILAHLVHMFRRYMAFRSIIGAKATIIEDRLTQTGLRVCKIGYGIRVSLLLFVVWLQVAIVMAIVGHYDGVWVFDASIPKGAVDWDSYTRVFLMAWSASILIAVTCRVFRDQLRTFYMMPAPLTQASHVLMSQVLVDSSDTRGDLAVTHCEVQIVHADEGRYVDFLLKRFSWCEEEQKFTESKVFSPAGPTGAEAEAIRRVGGLSSETVLERRKMFGKNEIVLQVPSLLRMTVAELSSFFYIYQISACWLPFYWDYLTVGFLTLVLVLLSALIKIRMEHKQKSLLKNMATLHGHIWAKRDAKWTRITSEELVVGDLVCLTASSGETSKEILVDCLILSGSAIVDEAALTGETMPVQKFSPPPNDQHRNPDEAEHKKFFLFAGTTLLQTGEAQDEMDGIPDGTLAVVTATAANTSRGSLMRGLIFGANIKSSLFVELRVSLAILVVIAVADFLSLNARFEMSLSSMLTAMYSIVGLINPLMAVSLVAGELRSASRLTAHKTLKVYTRDLHRLTVAGRVDLALLDKTGTITKSGLDLYGVVPAETVLLTDCSNKSSDISPNLSVALALAHTVSRCQDQLIGHQVELRMVEAAEKIGWVFDKDLRSPTSPHGMQWLVEKLFPFSHETMTMSAVVSSNDKRSVVCKGSFEALRVRCTGISSEMVEKATNYAKDGCYVIAVGVKHLRADPSRELDRGELEHDLMFAGLILFRNEVKADSKAAINELQAAGISVRMMTGDSVYTGAAVARQVGIIAADAKVVVGTINSGSRCLEWRHVDSDHVIDEGTLKIDASVALCVSGEAFVWLSGKGRLDLDATKVYGRVSPNQKAEIVKLYTGQGKVVTMCGDGANDSSGLRAAHAGLALCGRTEASISAPFSTDSDSLMALTLLIREARAALCTSLASYQSLVVVGILYCVSKSILLFQASAYQAGLAYLYLDVITTPAMLFGLVYAAPAKRLADRPPEGSLLGGQIVLSSIWAVVVCLAFLGIADGIMVHQSWFVPFRAEPGVRLEEWQKRGNNYEAALIFLWSAWVYVDVPLLFSTGGRHRAPIWTNWRLMLGSSGLLATAIGVLFVPSGEFGCYFKVACSAADSAAASGAFVNNFLFPYEQVGGVWHNQDIDSTEYPVIFKVGLLLLWLAMSLVLHLGHFFITSVLERYIRDTLRWDGSCLKRRRVARRKPETMVQLKVSEYSERIPQGETL